MSFCRNAIRSRIRAYARPLIVPPRYPAAVFLAQNAPTTVHWVAAFISAISTLFAIVTVIVAIWVARRDSRVQRADRADRDAAQARLVSAELRHEHGRWWVRTTNDSNAPVFRCDVVEVRHQRGARYLESIPGAPVELRKLGPDESIDRAVRGDGDLSDGVVVLRFVDAAGLRWCLEGDTAPRRLLD